MLDEEHSREEAHDDGKAQNFAASAYMEEVAGQSMEPWAVLASGL
jgi:hypothetical protein